MSDLAGWTRVALYARIEELEVQRDHLRLLAAKHHDMDVVRAAHAGQVCPACARARKCRVCREAMGDMGSGLDGKETAEEPHE